MSNKMDLIDRNELLEYQYHSSEWNDETQKFDSPVVDVEDIKNAPTVEAEPVKHGEWKEIVTHNGCTPDYDCICSNCNESGVPHYKYCPHCGAKMDLEELE